ncbi:hypothetical protein EKN56_01975 [Limnobaculum zhutongyuii]|uniref:WD40 repeat domain-containing protein n=1 Tax=Limnobaculum zhutongyuii TaxID=2498113 RepID=A0A411WGD7_9GAMM|nr:hypothetical protein [Limnobaculum zhutongyuii]QBH95279.1 hypothetical protein EKN56_01975 [Limnobaculum zhutongyuii]TQS89103.1 hypothetical protein ELQ32_07925 [Limnobaculum zhutongyuii]
MIVDKYIQLAGGCIADDKTIYLLSRDGELEYGQKHTEVNIWNGDKSKPLLESQIIKATVEAVVRYKNLQENFDGLCVLSSDCEIFFIQRGSVYKEKIKDVPSGNEINSLAVIDDVLYGCGDGAVVYKRTAKKQWMAIHEAISEKFSTLDLIIKMDEYCDKREKTDGVDSMTATLEWNQSERFKYTDFRRLWSINGNRQNNIYACGSVNTPKSKDGVLFNYDGESWKRLAIPETNTLSSLFVGDDGRVLTGGLEGHLLMSQDGVHFRDVSTPEDLMVINYIKSYRDKIYLGTSDGLFQYQNESIVTPDIAQDLNKVDESILTECWSIDICGDYLLLMCEYSAWRYCFTTGVCELLIKFTGRPEEDDDE